MTGKGLIFLWFCDWRESKAGKEEGEKGRKKLSKEEPDTEAETGRSWVGQVVGFWWEGDKTKCLANPAFMRGCELLKGLLITN